MCLLKLFPVRTTIMPKKTDTQVAETAAENVDETPAKPEQPLQKPQVEEKPKGAGGSTDEVESPTDHEDEEAPQILHASTMSRNEKNKVARIVAPKKYTGRLEVPNDIFQMWQTPKGKQQLFELWAKSGGVKAGNARVRSTRICVTKRDVLLQACQAVFMERVEVLSVTTRSKTIEVKGGFYSEEDMRVELQYSSLSGCISVDLA